jgi:hypothetical protein
MPIAVRVIRRRSRVEAILRGDLKLDEILQAIDRTVADPDFQAGFDILSDHRLVERPITRPELEEMTQHLRHHSGSFAGTRWAVVTIQPASFGMMRILSVLAESVPMNVQVFRELEAAERWLAPNGPHEPSPSAAA